MAVSCKTTIKKDVRKKHSRPSVVDDLKGTPTFDKEPKNFHLVTALHMLLSASLFSELKP